MIDNGPSANRVDIVFVGDGYTIDDISTSYVADINSMLDHMFASGEDPFPRYSKFFNTHRVDVISAQSGADVPPEGIFRDTALDASYYFDGTTERLLHINETKANEIVSTEMATAGFTPEMRLATINDSRYGGAGGQWASFAGKNSSAPEIALHELGHSFSGLADEYGGDTTPYTGGEPSAVNVTTDPSGTKWAQWLGYDQPGIGIIAAYEGGNYSDFGVYRPSLDSKMRSLERPFDAISREQLILDIYTYVDPLDVWRDNSTSVSGPLSVQVVDPQVISVDWYVDGNLVVQSAGETFDPENYGFTSGTHTVTAKAIDRTDWVRINRESLEQSVSWTYVAFGIPIIPTFTRGQKTEFERLPELGWDVLPGVDHYDIWIDNVSAGVSQYIRNSNFTSTNFIAATAWPIGNYRAWVRGAMTNGITTVWSQELDFRIVGAPMVTQGQDVTFKQTPVIAWNAIPGAHHYDIWIDCVSSGVNQYIRNSNFTSTTFIAGNTWPIGNYRAWVRGVATDGFATVWSSAVNFSINNAPKVTQGQNSTFDNTPVFAWNLLPGAERYQVFIQDLRTGTTTLDQKNITGLQFTPTASLNDGPYRWWVRGETVQGFQSLRSASMDIYIGGRTKILAPSGAINDTTPTFTWQKVDGAARYDLWVDEVGGQSQIIRRQSLTTTSFTANTELPIGNHRVWVRGITTDGFPTAWSSATNFSINGAPTVTQGQNSTFDNTPVFAWNALPGAVKYEVFIENVSTGATTLDQKNITGLQFTPTASLNDGLYRWRVRAETAEGFQSQWSARMDISIGGRTKLLAPSGTTTDTTPTFTWQKVDGVGRYDLWVDKVGGQSQIIRQQFLTTTSFTPSTALPAGTYRAWIRAVATTGQTSVWSQFVEFIIT